jgi:hypothetical protein
MSEDNPPLARRTLLQAALAAGALTAPAGAHAQTASSGKKAAGKPGDFDFLTGEWKIRNRRTKKDGGVDEFDGEASVYGILSGVASIEELRIPARGFSGMGLRILDIGKGLWSDFWVNAKSGVLAMPGATGVFIDGVGEFAGDDASEPVRAKGVWDLITPISCRWRQLLSHDGGATWTEDWDMRWTRVR